MKKIINQYESEDAMSVSSMDVATSRPVPAPRAAGPTTRQTGENLHRQSVPQRVKPVNA